jgi:outer membrane protein assembly factor BamB
MKAHYHVLILALAAVLLLSGCSAQQMNVSWPGLAADETTAYIAKGSHVYAVDLASRTESWRFPRESDNKKLFFATPALTPDGQVIIGSEGADHILLSLDSRTGAERWTFTGAGKTWIGGALILDEAIYAPNTDGSLYALDLEGNLLWTFTAGEALWGRPATDGERIFIGSLDHHLYALDAASGQLLWKVDLGGAIVGPPGVGPDGTLYIGLFNPSMLALDPASGATLWSTAIQGWVWNGPALADDLLFFGDLNGYFYALSSGNGRLAWEPEQPDGPVVGQPLVSGEAVIFVTESGTVYALDRQGRALWTFQTGEDAKIYTTPVQSGDLYLITPMQTDYLLLALDLNGRQAWTFTPGK